MVIFLCLILLTALHIILSQWEVGILLYKNIMNYYNYPIVQVPGDSDIPDNIYTGGIYYERIASNKWLTRFIVIQNIKVFLEVILIITLLHYHSLHLCISNTV